MFRLDRPQRAASWIMTGLCLLAWTGGGWAAEPVPAGPWAIALHGGAGLDPEHKTPEGRRAYVESLSAALRVGQKILREGGTALDAVEQVIRVLEDDPLFNAGRGAVFNRVGRHELDASIMDGRTKQCGAVASVTTVKNPISLARLVMTETRHVLLAGEGAEAFADEMRERPQIRRVENSYFSTERQRREWQQALDAEKKGPGKRGGTVGCVALDRHGNLAAGTSTGGLTNKRFGRIGDSPIVGAGTYADNATSAVSCTGIGEHFIRHAVAFHVSALQAYAGLTLDEAVRRILEKTLPDDVGGLIAVDRRGQIVMRTNTDGMARAAADSHGRWEIGLERADKRR